MVAGEIFMLDSTIESTQGKSDTRDKKPDHENRGEFKKRMLGLDKQWAC